MIIEHAFPQTQLQQGAQRVAVIPIPRHMYMQLMQPGGQFYL
jgi:hypothetical protein